MLETHPFGYFAPPHSRYLLLGSFTTKPEPNYDWFYSSKRNQFWPILRTIYRRPLDNRLQKEHLFTDLNMAISDVIYQCERLKNSNLDLNLTNMIYNLETVTHILDTHPIEKVFFTSRFVENIYRKKFQTLVTKWPNIQYFTLPSPSPRYATMSFTDKVKHYSLLLPDL